MKSPFINVTIPVYNEEKTLVKNVGRVALFLEMNCPPPFEIVIADNASTDRTWEFARRLQAQDERVRAVHLDEKGRGRAIKKVWKQSEADILSYMDCDLSTDLAAFPALIEALVNGGFELATGSRLLDGSRTVRGMKREIISRAYNLLIKALFRTKFSDAQCGFKAITRRTASEILPLVQDDCWFMDTELLILAEKHGRSIFDLPVRWMDDPDSRVKIWSTAFADIKGLIRLRRSLACNIATITGNPPAPAQEKHLS